MKDLLTRLLLAVGVLRGATRMHERPSDDDGVDPSRYEIPRSPRNEAIVAALLVAAGLLLAAFGVLLAVNGNTQLLGGLLGGGLLALAAALIVAGKGVVPQETSVQERITGDPPEETEQTEQVIADAATGVSRRRLLGAAAGVTGAGALTAAALPLTAIGPSPKVLLRSPWRSGLRLVSEEGAPVSADELEVGSFLTAFPEHVEMRDYASPLVVVRIDPKTLDLPAGRDDWAPEGILAFSKVCTHAACAVSLFRHPVDEQLSSGPALVCPCHYSTFDVRRGALVVFGPAGRPLPQLPLGIDDARNLHATGPLSGSVGPAWWGVKRDDL